MTIINRALTKAYQRRSDTARANARDERPASISGWAPTLRDPLRPIPAPAQKAADPGATPITRDETAAPAAPTEAHVGATLRIDQGQGVAKPQATVIVPPATEPAVLPITREETAAPAAPSDVHAPPLRVDLGHVILGDGIAKSQATVIAPPTAPREAPAKQDDPVAEIAAIGTIAGATVRVDPGHVVAKPQATTEAPAAESEPVTDTAQPAIDAAPRWSWPPIVARLLDCSAGAELRKLAASLKHLAATRRLACLALSGPGRAAGRTSLVLTLAHVLAETQSCRVAIVDADFGHPQAADLLSLRPRRGLWEAACEKGTAGAAAVMPLIEGKLSVVPLVERIAPETIDRAKIGALQSFLRSLRRDNDVVLVDAGPWETLVPPLVFESRAVDALLCVARHDAGAERLDDDDYRQPGVEWLGMIETFAPPDDGSQEK